MAKDLIPESEAYSVQEVLGNAVTFWIRYNGTAEDIRRLLWSFAHAVRNSYDGSVYDSQPFDNSQCADVENALLILKKSDMTGLRVFMDVYMCEPHSVLKEGIDFEFEQLSQHIESDVLTNCLYNKALPWFVMRYPQTDFEVGYTVNGMEGSRSLLYKNGRLTQEKQWHCSIYDGKWALNKISFSGGQKEIEKLCEDLNRENILLDIYREGGEGFFCGYEEIIVEEKTADHIIFYALETVYEEGVTLTHSLFTAKKLAEKYPAIGFETTCYLKGDCEKDNEPFVETARFRNGECEFRKKSKDSETINAFISSIPKNIVENNVHYREMKSKSTFPDFTTEKTTEEWIATVTQWGGALRYIPNEEKTPSLCLSAVKSMIDDDLSPLDILEYIPTEMRTEELCFAVYDSFNDEERASLSDSWKKEAFCGIPARTWYKKGVEYYNNNEEKEALDMFTRAVAAQNDYAAAYYKRAAILYAMGKRKDAVRDYSKAVEFGSQGHFSYLADCYFQRGKIYEEMKRYKLYAEDCKTAFELNLSDDETSKLFDELNTEYNKYLDAAEHFPYTTEYLSLDGTHWERVTQKIVSRISFDKVKFFSDKHLIKQDETSSEKEGVYIIEGNIVTLDDDFLTQYEITGDKLYPLPFEEDNYYALKSGKPAEGKAEISDAGKSCIVCGKTLRSSATFCSSCCASQNFL